MPSSSSATRILHFRIATDGSESAGMHEPSRGGVGTSVSRFITRISFGLVGLQRCVAGRHRPRSKVFDQACAPLLLAEEGLFPLCVSVLAGAICTLRRIGVSPA